MKSLKSQLGRKIVSSFISIAILFEAPIAFANQTRVIPDVSAQLKRIANAKESFCFAVENGAVTGINENEPVRTASVTKTLTTFWAIERLGPNFQYATRIFVQPSTGEVHIEGGRDPFFDTDRLFTLLADLNAKRVTKINRLTFDANFWFWPQATEFRYFGGGGSSGGHGGKAHARGKDHGHHHGRRPSSVDRSPASANGKFFESEDHTDQTVAGNMEKVKRDLSYLLNTANWSAAVRSRYSRARAMNPKAKLPASVKMLASVVDLVPHNPLEGKPNVYEFVVRSAPIKMYLKRMNISSINPYAEEIFFSLGGKAGFVNFMSRFKMSGAVSNVNSGSGVNLHNGPRYDSMVSCATVVRMIRKMDRDLLHQGLNLTDVLAVPGIDGGTWQDASKTLVVKTGTLGTKNLHTVKNLAGVEETRSGEVYFGIFIDKKGVTSYNVEKALGALRQNFTGVQVTERKFVFEPIGEWTHLQTQPSNVSLVRK